MGQYYNVEVLNVPDSVLSGCRWIKNMILWDWKYNLLLEYFDEVSPEAMQQGDVCIWTGGEGGHIAIFDHYDPDNNQCYYFSQNPNSCQVMPINMDGHHAFRRKGVVPPAPLEPTPVITPNVQRDEYRDQIEVKATQLRVRTVPSTSGEILGYASIGYYNFYETKEADGYVWYNIDEGQWVASSDEWTTVYLAKEKPQSEYKILKWEDILEKTAKELNTTVDELIKLNNFNYSTDKNAGLCIRVK